MTNAGFVHQGANGNTILRWWPVIVFLIIQISGAAAIAWQVTETRSEIKTIRENMVTIREWDNLQMFRTDQIDGIRNEQKEVKRRLEVVENGGRR